MYTANRKQANHKQWNGVKRIGTQQDGIMAQINLLGMNFMELYLYDVRFFRGTE